MYTFEDLGQKLQESKKRWEDISALGNILEHELKTNPNLTAIEATTLKLVLLLVEQLKPMVDFDSTMLDDSLKEVLNVFTGGKIKNE